MGSGSSDDDVPRVEPTAGRSDASIEGRERGTAPHSDRIAGAARVATEAELDAPSGRTLSAAEVGRHALASSVFVRVGATYGAGIVLDPRGWVLTCEHVIHDAATPGEIRIDTPDGGTFTAEHIERDGALDLALLQVPALARGTAARLGSITSVELGDDVFAMGAPKKMAFSLHRGMVSFVGREFEGLHYLQTDLPTSGGSSGGPVLNARGEVVAIASFVLRDSEGLAFALPIDYAYQRFAAQLHAPAVPTKQAPRFAQWLASAEQKTPRR